MHYQPCRWYDPYPGLVFVLKLIQLMPKERQMVVGERLNHYLDIRLVAQPLGKAPAKKGNRWYDQVDSLMEGLERLKYASLPLKQQSTDYLFKLLEEKDSISSS